MKPHKHAELIKAWADGAEIEERHIQDNNEWSKWYSFDCTWWVDNNDYEYRIKPEPKPDVVRYAYVGWFGTNYSGLNKQISKYANLKLTFDETGELKSAEVLKHQGVKNERTI